MPEIAEEFTAKITDMDQETATMQTQVQQMQQQSDLGRQRVEHLGKTQENSKVPWIRSQKRFVRFWIKCKD